MKKVLIIAYLFAQENAIGSIRPLKIKKYLEKDGYSIQVITAAAEKEIHSTKVDAYKNVIFVEHSHQFRQIYNKLIHNNLNNVVSNSVYSNREPKQKRNGLKRQIKITIRKLLDCYKSIDFYKEVKKKIKESDINIGGYETVLTTYGPLANVLIGLWIKRKWRTVNWICDFRDPMVTSLTPVSLKPFLNYFQEKACMAADSIVCVSNGYLKRVCGKKYLNKAYMIPNGYDLDDFQKMDCETNSKKLILTYVGALYEGKRDISPVFQAINDLISEKKIDKKQICFYYAGGDYKYLLNQAQKYQLQEILINHGKLPREKCLKLQFRSDILVLSTWNERGEEGVFPGKFIEYMLINKPIISLVDGNLGGSEVSRVINEAQLGVAYESVNHENDSKMVKLFIENQYIQRKKGEQVFFQPKQEVLECYNYTNIIKKIEELIKNVSHEQ